MVLPLEATQSAPCLHKHHATPQNWTMDNPLFIQGWGVILLWALCSEATPDYAQGLCSAEDGAGSTQSENLNLGLSLWSSLFAIDNCTEVDQFGSPFSSKASW